MIWLLLACAATGPSPTGDPDTGGGSADGGGGVLELPRPLFANPAEAEDLDSADDTVHVALIAASAVHEFDEAQGFDDGLTVDGYAYNGQVPGPTIRARLGDTVVVDLDNELDEATTIHWHGVEVPWAMDGVTWMQDPIEPGEGFTYTFTVNRAGTYWYHPHFDTDHQVDRGLYGALIVEDPDDPPVDRELIAVFDPWEEEREDTGGADGEGDAHGLDFEVPPWTVNGLREPVVQVSAGETVRLRAINASNQGYLDLAMEGLRQIGSDQGLLPDALEPDSVLLAPGDRADLEIRPGETDLDLVTQPWSLHGGAALGDDEALLSLAVPEPGSAAQSPTWPFQGGSPSADPGSTAITYVFQGSDEGGTWMINGEVYPDVSVEELPIGESAVVEVRNLSPTEHPFHLHGNHFEVLSVGGAQPDHLAIEDTINVGIHQQVRLLVRPDNPGDWMAHCHILPHADQGMMTVLRVVDAGSSR